MSTWGLYPWFRESGLELIHPDDRSLVETYSPYCRVCEAIGRDGPYFVLRYDEHQFRGKPELFQPISPPIFVLGQTVRTREPRTIREGVVRSIVWHYQIQEPLYFLTVSGKRLSSQFRANELESV